MKSKFIPGMLFGVLVTVVIGVIYLLMVKPAYSLLSSQLRQARQTEVQEADEVNGEEADTLLAAITRLDKRIATLELAPVGGPAVVESQDVAAEAEASSAEPSEVTTEEGGAVLTVSQSSGQMGAWEIQYYTGATQMMKNWVFSNPDPTWAEFPNVDWPAGNFVSAHGLEYGQELSDFCQQDTRCDFPVAARSFRSITADYSIAGVGECQEGGTGIGCAVILINVGDVSAEFRDQQVDIGHTITGLYWHGDFLNEAISALASHLAYRMIGVPSGNPASPGANCSVPAGCEGVDITFVVLSGNELLLRGHTVVRP